MTRDEHRVDALWGRVSIDPPRWCVCGAAWIGGRCIRSGADLSPDHVPAPAPPASRLQWGPFAIGIIASAMVCWGFLALLDVLLGTGNKVAAVAVALAGFSIVLLFVTSAFGALIKRRHR